MQREKSVNKSLKKIKFLVLESNSENFFGGPLFIYHLAANFNIKLEKMISKLKKHLKTIILTLIEGFSFLQLTGSLCDSEKRKFVYFQNENFLNLFEIFNKNKIIRKEKEKKSLNQKTIKFNLNSMEKKSAVLKKFTNFNKKYLGLFLKSIRKVNAWSHIEWKSSVKQSFFSIFLIIIKKNIFLIKKVTNKEKQEILMGKKIGKMYLQSCFFNSLNNLRKGL